MAAMQLSFHSFSLAKILVSYMESVSLLVVSLVSWRYLCSSSLWVKIYKGLIPNPCISDFVSDKFESHPKVTLSSSTVFSSFSWQLGTQFDTCSHRLWSSTVSLRYSRVRCPDITCQKFEWLWDIKVKLRYQYGVAEYHSHKVDLSAPSSSPPA